MRPSTRRGHTPVAIYRRTILAYLLVTVAVTWALWAGPSLAGLDRDGLLWRPCGPVFLLGVFTPALTGIAFTARESGSAGVRRQSRAGHDVGVVAPVPLLPARNR